MSEAVPAACLASARASAFRVDDVTVTAVTPSHGACQPSGPDGEGQARGQAQ